MPEAPAKLTRRELYELIWTTPATKLAKDFGISDVGLAKNCKRHQIPRPPRGYWAKLAAGHRIRRTPLPKIADPSLEEIVIYRSPTSPIEDSSGKPIPIIVVPSVLRKPHALTATTQRHLKHAATAQSGILQPDAKTCLEIYVTKPVLDRALLIFDTFIKYWESIGGSVTVGHKNQSDELVTLLCMDGCALPLTLSEKIKRTTLEPNPARQWEKRYSYQPTGRLFFETASSRRWSDGRWGDGLKQKLESTLGAVVCGLTDLVRVQRLGRLDEECQNRQKDKLNAVREESQRRKEKEDSRRASLVTDVTQWRKAEDIRAYLAVLRGRVDAGVYRVKDATAFEQWFEWAKWFADVCDPLVDESGRPDVVAARTNVPLGDLDITRATRSLIEKLGATDCDSLAEISFEEFESCKPYSYSAWGEVTRVLEIHGYDISHRKRGWLWGS